MSEIGFFFQHYAAATLEGATQFLSRNLGELVAGFGGAFFGALSAYLLERRRERTRTADERHSAILAAH